MATNQLTVRIRLRWWLKHWLRALVVINGLTGWKIDEAKSSTIIKRGLYVERVK